MVLNISEILGVILEDFEERLGIEAGKIVMLEELVGILAESWE